MTLADYGFLIYKLGQPTQELDAGIEGTCDCQRLAAGYHGLTASPGHEAHLARQPPVQGVDGDSGRST